MCFQADASYPKLYKEMEGPDGACQVLDHTNIVCLSKRYL